MRFCRRLLALSLNLLLLQTAWTSSRGECAPAEDAAHGSHVMAMTAPVQVRGSDEHAIRDASEGEGHDCSGDMLSADCGLMAGCATTTPLATNALQSARASTSLAVVAFALTSVPIAAPQPEPPPPRA